MFLSWVAWVAWSHGTPDAESAMVGFDVASDSSATAQVDVQLETGVEATCKVRAFAEDHTIVGEVSFTPEEGRNEVTVRTERRANTVELVGCVTSDQQRPR
ncbi:DUF4307 domain-containing protein [Nocardioides piscis]|uniref:DUF4307 domain-containing protein n=1 Tax=Nocardioides piscis TaxID=2714938 RepID=UPI001FE545F9|nr:DUF4307 domain-containing protein [Nocardioides piscis]